MGQMNKRRSLSASEKLTVMRRQDFKCNCGCGETLDPTDTHYDHILPLWLGGTNDISNFQALKRKHHGKKTTKEAKNRAKADRIRNREGLLKKRMSERDRAVMKMLEPR